MAFHFLFIFLKKGSIINALEGTEQIENEKERTLMTLNEKLNCIYHNDAS